MGEQYISKFEKPSPYEREILTIMQEECAEIIVQISKALRFGLDDGYPGGNETNRQAIGRELGDLDVITELAKQNGLFSGVARVAAHDGKRRKLARFMQTHPEDARS